MNRHCYQVNLQEGWGGGEVYTAFFTRALLAAGIPTTLFASAGNPHWAKHLPAGCRRVAVRDVAGIAAHLPDQPCWLLFQTPAAAAELAPLAAAGHRLDCIAHMPLYGRDPERLREYRRIYCVSGHVLASLAAAGIESGYPEPLWGIADLAHRQGNSAIFAASPYDWDRRKGRDRLLSWLYPLYDLLRPARRYRRGEGITLGIVSRLTPIKQFPLLFGHLAPILARYPQFRLEVFGAGGYASVRDLRRALAPIRTRVRFWGAQADVGTVYRQIDYLLTGLPEKEALGLNVLEAQACGTPVLAVAAPPFTETVADGITGLFYADPRGDGGHGFVRLLERLALEPFRIDGPRAAAHLAQFAEPAFNVRVARLAEAALAPVASAA